MAIIPFGGVKEWITVTAANWPMTALQLLHWRRNVLNSSVVLPLNYFTRQLILEFNSWLINCKACPKCILTCNLTHTELATAIFSWTRERGRSLPYILVKMQGHFELISNCAFISDAFRPLHQNLFKDPLSRDVHLSRRQRHKQIV